jgi:hypothetical protein
VLSREQECNESIAATFGEKRECKEKVIMTGTPVNSLRLSKHANIKKK